MALALKKIINLSIIVSTFPEKCKTAKSKPIFKKGVNTDTNNYRPASVLPLASKLIEQLKHFQIEDYLNDNKLIDMY